jgi:hypothetical protein
MTPALLGLSDPLADATRAERQAARKKWKAWWKRQKDE